MHIGKLPLTDYAPQVRAGSLEGRLPRDELRGDPTNERRRRRV
jgi:hypothetical protein